MSIGFFGYDPYTAQQNSTGVNAKSGPEKAFRMIKQNQE